jgi:hydrogenase expression/formation protein HypD
MLHVPGKTGTLARMKAQGADIRVVTTPLQALTLAKEQPQKKYVFTAVGFETTAPVTAQAVRLASRERLGNLSFLVAHRIVPPVLKVLLEDPDLKLSGFLLPGHVSAIIGERAYTFLANYHKPGVIVGFESVDILSGLLTLLLIIAEPTHTSYLKNMYTRIVTPQGNCKARQVIEEVYEVKDAVLRGIGLVPGCGLKLKDRFSTYDAEVQYDLSMDGDEMPAGCACGQILKGVKRPDECPLFNSICTPQHPIGPCMVSSEGSCAAYYKYGY